MDGYQNKKGDSDTWLQAMFRFTIQFQDSYLLQFRQSFMDNIRINKSFLVIPIITIHP